MANIHNGQILGKGGPYQAAATGRSWILFIINLPLLAEVVRKYILQQDLIFFGMATSALLSFLALLFMPKTGVLRSLPLRLWLAMLAFYLWGFVNEVVGGHSLIIFLIGLGTLFLPVVYMLVSNVYFQQGEGAVHRVFLCVNFWLLVILAVALLQIYLGRDHPFSTYGLGSAGVGDYSVGGRVVGWLYRPTSIFTHTGKFGQAVFCLVLFKWCYLVVTQRPIRWFLKISIGLDVLAVIVSGQRAAFVFLVLSAGLLLLYKVIRGGRRTIVRLFGYSLLGVLALAVVFLQTTVMSDRALNLVIDRLASGVYDIPIRLEGNFFLPFGTVMDKYLIFGEGLGRFTLGTAHYGGSVVYESVEMPGLGENSWIRLIAEVGIIGTILYLTILLQLLHLASRSVFSRLHQENEMAALFFSLWLGSIMLWANTHDVFGNMIVTSLAFALGGGVLNRNESHEDL